MNIPLRIKQVKVISSEKRFSFLRGLRTLWFNLKALFTQRLFVNGAGWYEEKKVTAPISDNSCIVEDGILKFIKTPSGNHDSALEITQDIDKEQ